MSLSQTTVLKLYQSVIEDTMNASREYFAEEGVDEQILLELRQSWESKAMTSKAVSLPPPQEVSQLPKAISSTAVKQNKTQIQYGPTIDNMVQNYVKKTNGASWVHDMEKHWFFVSNMTNHILLLLRNFNLLSIYQTVKKNTILPIQKNRYKETFSNEYLQLLKTQITRSLHLVAATLTLKMMVFLTVSLLLSVNR